MTRNRTDAVDDVETVDEGRSRGYGRNTWRGLMTLIGAAVAGFLIWLAHYPNIHATRGFWGAMGLIAAAGFALGLSQLFGGWTKFGWPKISLAVLLLGWLPTAVAVGWIGLALQPSNGWQEGRLDNWSSSLGIGGFVHDFAPFLPALALGFGIVTAFVFDTTGPRTRRVDVTTPPRRTVPDEDVHDYRHEDDATAVDSTRTTTTAPTTTTGARTTDDRVEVHDPATTEPTTTTGARTTDDRVEVHDPATRRY